MALTRSSLLLAFLALPAAQVGELRDRGRLKHPPINESSGLVRSRTFPGVWWTHNDSGDLARIFAVDADGKAIVPERRRSRFAVDGPDGDKPYWPGVALIGAANSDFEDIAIDGDRLYVCDVGNNSNARRDLGVYVVPEVNPRASESVRPLAYWPIRFPDQRRFPAEKFHFDCEAVFVSEGKLYFLTKHRGAAPVRAYEAGTKLYRLDTRHSDRPNTLTLIEERGGLLAPTGSDLSPSGRRLAVLCVDAVWLFDKPARGDRWLSGAPLRFPLPLLRSKQIEAVCFDSEDQLRLTNEQRDIFLMDLPAAKPGREKRQKRLY